MPKKNKSKNKKDKFVINSKNISEDGDDIILKKSTKNKILDLNSVKKIIDNYNLKNSEKRANLDESDKEDDLTFYLNLKNDEEKKTGNLDVSDNDDENSIKNFNGTNLSETPNDNIKLKDKLHNELKSTKTSDDNNKLTEKSNTELKLIDKTNFELELIDTSDNNVKLNDSNKLIDESNFELNLIDKPNSLLKLIDKPNAELELVKELEIQFNKESIVKFSNFVINLISDLVNTNNQLTNRVANLESEFVKFKDNNISNHRNLIQDDELTQLYSGSNCLVAADALKSALKKDKVSQNSRPEKFFAKIFSSVVKVSDVYRRTLSGRSTSKRKKKLKFSSIIKNELLNAAVFYFKNEKKENLETILEKTITNKLSNFNSLFEKLIAGEIYSKELVERVKLSKFDPIYLNDFEDYKLDIEKFKLLDESIEDELNKENSNKNKKLSEENSKLDKNENVLAENLNLNKHKKILEENPMKIIKSTKRKHKIIESSSESSSESSNDKLSDSDIDAGESSDGSFVRNLSKDDLKKYKRFKMQQKFMIKLNNEKRNH